MVVTKKMKWTVKSLISNQVCRGKDPASSGFSSFKVPRSFLLQPSLYILPCSQKLFLVCHSFLKLLSAFCETCTNCDFNRMKVPSGKNVSYKNAHNSNVIEFVIYKLILEVIRLTFLFYFMVMDQWVKLKRSKTKSIGLRFNRIVVSVLR